MSDPAGANDWVWWRDGVLYQIYPRSFSDSNGDGVGDLRGITGKLDYLQWLGVDGIWINPITAGPNDDWGYDVSDYCAVHPDLGTIDDLDDLIAEATERNIRVMLDLVPNHSSNQHAWFIDAASSRTSAKRDYYVWADPAEDGGPPNNWVNTFNPGASAWTFDAASGQYYLNQFLSSQPDLNWWSDEVRDEFDRIFRFWYDRGVAGFRLDVCHAVVKDQQLRDNPPTEAGDHWYTRMYAQRFVYNTNRPEVHDVIRRWRSIADSYDDPRVLVGETYVLDSNAYAAFYGNDDELNLAFNMILLHSQFDAGEMRAAVESAEEMLPKTAWPTWTGGNHDNHRWATRWCNNEPDKIRAAMVMLMTLRGTPFLYYGDEIGMPDTDVPENEILDPVGHMFGPRMGRDNERTPMHWNAATGAGFSDPGVVPWLRYGDHGACNVAAQVDDPASMLAFTRRLIALRRESSDLRRGPYASLPTSDDSNAWAWRRGSNTVVAMNFSNDAIVVDNVRGNVILSSAVEPTNKPGDMVNGVLTLAANEAVIVVSTSATMSE